MQLTIRPSIGSNQATVLLQIPAVCILTRRLDVFMSRDGRCGEVKGCCRFFCHSAPLDMGPGKTRGSLWRSGRSKVKTWQSSGFDLRREWVSVGWGGKIWGLLTWAAVTQWSLNLPFPLKPPPPTSTHPHIHTHTKTHSVQQLNCSQCFHSSHQFLVNCSFPQSASLWCKSSPGRDSDNFMVINAEPPAAGGWWSDCRDAHWEFAASCTLVTSHLLL